MPLYMTNAVQGAITDAAKQKIATDITRIHCDVTDAPPAFVHAFFVEDAPHMPLDGKAAFLLGSIRAGRSAEQKAQIIDEMRQAIHEHSGLPQDDIQVVIRDTPASWVMEGGDIMPEPGEEDDWFAAHEARKAAENA
ncbi:Phenylpyruvate tautomerase PptA, 4-oxalocrotonate tautomerase family [Parasphingorhabdus marina DSM 22363]|uniref:Phenylpyruvate tautomerase PptA, 4-oxalocrotonate tautomerase family n=1 Tax=Parasphingorhabdus marina DSM 22363 TaxID=1123272 RepID=A0A1N6GS85_9SPHN|nr:tautomerase family protein [Parasphingorhabdus marina]SIO10441.1 Phenylpyruvate tautomerase PptA, 4-oxalocrotonate tautomerase family [Parasphingorhabdus marina DSM 22363]